MNFWLENWLKNSLGESTDEEGVRALSTLLRNEAVYTPATVALLSSDVLDFLGVSEITAQLLKHSACNLSKSLKKKVHSRSPTDFVEWAQRLDPDYKVQDIFGLAAALNKLVGRIQLMNLLSDVIIDDFKAAEITKLGYRLHIDAAAGKKYSIDPVLSLKRGRTLDAPGNSNVKISRTSC